jgi:hypothetical protein
MMIHTADEMTVEMTDEMTDEMIDTSESDPSGMSHSTQF